MLSIEHSNNTAAAVRYFRENLAQADYYCEKTQIIGQWDGKLAENLNLKGDVRADDFEKLLYNINPETNSRLTARNSANRRPMYDCTFSSIKSASLIYAITGDEDILKAHQAGVKAAMMEIEANLQTQMGSGKGKHYETTGQGLWAEFTHKYARPIEHKINGQKVMAADPQLHSHCTLINATQHDGQNRYRALEMSNIKRLAPYYESLYHSVYGHHLKEAGYQLEKSGKRWEIKDIERETIEKFSGRYVEIERLAKKRGIINQKAKSKLGRLTRNDKNQSVAEEMLPDIWKARLNAKEYKTIISAKGSPPDNNGGKDGGNTPPTISPDKAASLSINHFMERNSAVPFKRVQARAIDMVSGQAHPDEVKKAFEKRGDLILAKRNDVAYMTTKSMLHEEAKLIQRAAKGKATKPSINPNYKIQNKILNEGQRAAIEHVLTSQDQIVVVAGDAGVGKTTLLQECKKGINEAGKELYGFGPSAGSSRDVLREKGFEDANTVAMLLKSQKLQEKLQNQNILIDEAGLIGVATLNRVLDIAEAKNARVVLSGDWKQHHAVEAGDALKTLEVKAGLDVARVEEIVRQRNAKTYKDIIADMAKGISFKNNPLKREHHIDKAFSKLEKVGAIKELPNKEERERALAKDYVREIEKPNSTVLVVSPTNHEAKSITSAIRAELKATGKIAAEERVFTRLQSKHFTGSEKQISYHYDRNDVIEFRQNTQGFKAGYKYEVQGLDANGRVLVQSKTQNTPTPLPLDRHDIYEVYQKEQIPLAKGDKVRITKNLKSHDGAHELFNGQIYGVQGFDPLGNIKLSNGRILDKNAAHFTHGIVSTSHAAQGKDADTIFLAQSRASVGASNQNQFYVSISRGVQNCKIYTDDKAELKRAISRPAERISASEIAAKAKREKEIVAQRGIHFERVRNFYDEKIKPSIESIKSRYDQRGLEKEVWSRDIGFER